MKIIRYLLITTIVFSISFGTVPPRVQAQQSDEEMAQQLASFIKALYPWSQRVLAHFSAAHNVQVDALNFESQVKRIYPRTYKYVQDQARRELGLVNVSLPQGSATKQGGGGGGGAYGALAALLFFQVRYYRERNETRQQLCMVDLLNPPTLYTTLQAEMECNWQSDQAVELSEILTIINPLGVPASFIARLQEWYIERGRRYSIWYYLYEGPGHRRPRPQNQYKPPGGTISGGPCGGPASVFEGGLTGERPGTDLPHFDGGVITVTADDPCRVGH